MWIKEQEGRAGHWLTPVRSPLQKEGASWSRLGLCYFLRPFEELCPHRNPGGIFMGSERPQLLQSTRARGGQALGQHCHPASQSYAGRLGRSRGWSWPALSHAPSGAVGRSPSGCQLSSQAARSPTCTQGLADTAVHLHAGMVCGCLREASELRVMPGCCSRLGAPGAQKGTGVSSVLWPA